MCDTGGQRLWGVGTGAPCRDRKRTRESPQTWAQQANRHQERDSRGRFMTNPASAGKRTHEGEQYQDEPFYGAAWGWAVSGWTVLWCCMRVNSIRMNRSMVLHEGEQYQGEPVHGAAWGWIVSGWAGVWFCSSGCTNKIGEGGGESLETNKNAFQSKAYHSCNTYITKHFQIYRKFISFPSNLAQCNLDLQMTLTFLVSIVGIQAYRSNREVTIC